MTDRLPNVGERVGFVDDGYADRTGTVMGVGDFYHCPMLYVRPDGEWPADELGEDGTLSLTAEECWELEPEPDISGASS